MHLSEPHLLALSQMACCKVLLSGEGADDGRLYALQNLTTSISSACDYATWQFRFVFKKPLHNKLLRFAQIQKKSDLVFFNGSNIYLRILQPLLG
jgi:asparagine synthase (glutamine-hydrolysing)